MAQLVREPLDLRQTLANSVMQNGVLAGCRDALTGRLRHEVEAYRFVIVLAVLNLLQNGTCDWVLVAVIFVDALRVDFSESSLIHVHITQLDLCILFLESSLNHLHFSLSDGLVSSDAFTVQNESTRQAAVDTLEVFDGFHH